MNTKSIIFWQHTSIEMKTKLIILIVSMFLSASSQAEIFSTSISSLKGRYEYLDDSRTVSFDMGVRFSSITSASIKLTAQGVDGLAQVCNTMITGLYSSSYSCTDYRESPKAFYRFSSENFTDSGTLVVDATDWNTTSAVLPVKDHLLNGKGTLQFDVAEMDFHGYITVSPFLYVSDISIVIDGIVAPSEDSLPPDNCQGISGTGTVASNLDIHAPLLNYYKSSQETQSIWSNLEYLGKNSQEEHVWGLKSFGVNHSNNCTGIVGTGTVLSNLDIFIPSMNFETSQGTQNIWAKLKYLGVNFKEQHIWKLKYLENFIYED